MSHFKVFSLSVLGTMASVLCYLAVQRLLEMRNEPKLTRIGDAVFLTSQLAPNSMPHIQRRFIGRIVDLRPDGEAEGQPSSEEMKRAAEAAQLEFHYIPVPHEDLPDEAVEALRVVLKSEREHTIRQRTVLYCRTGRRAVRLYALAIASNLDGPDTEEILKLVRSAGFDADDLRERIDQRVAKRADNPLHSRKGDML